MFLLKTVFWSPSVPENDHVPCAPPANFNSVLEILSESHSL